MKENNDLKKINDAILNNYINIERVNTGTNNEPAPISNK